MHWSVYVCACVCACAWVSWRWSRRRLLAVAKHLPGPPTVPILGNALKFICKPEEFIPIMKATNVEYGDVYRVWLGPVLNIVVNNPDDLKILLTSSQLNMKGPQYKYMADLLGPGILSGSGPKWRKHRKIATPNYTKRAVQNYSEVVNKETKLMIEQLRTRDSGQRNIYKDIVMCTTYTVCQTLMGLSRDQSMCLPKMQKLVETTGAMYKHIFDRMSKWYLQIPPVYWMSETRNFLNAFTKDMFVFCEAIVNCSLVKLDSTDINLKGVDDIEGVNTNLSIVDRFILSQEMSKTELCQEIYTIFTSSQEATAKIASYLILMMAFHPECQEKLHAEIVQVIGKEDRDITGEDLKQMPYLDMVYKEIVRMFPIGAMLQRTVMEDIEISTCTLPAGCSLIIPIYHMHRDPRFWTNPEAFDPERFTDVNEKKRNPNCYIPFSLGPMDCLGRYFATKLVKTICVRLLHEFKVSTTNKYEDLRLAFAISVSSLDGFPVSLHPRT